MGLKDLLVLVDNDPPASLVWTWPPRSQLIERALELAGRLRQRVGLPPWIVLDEAHYSLHEQGVREAALGLEHRGFCLVTYKPSWIRPSVLDRMDVLVLARTTAREELSLLRRLLGDAGEDAQRAIGVLPDLPSGEFVLVPPPVARPLHGGSDDRDRRSPRGGHDGRRHLHQARDHRIARDHGA